MAKRRPVIRSSNRAAGHRLAVILPPAEPFTPSAADAVSLFVRDTTFHSTYNSKITVYGEDKPRTRLFRDVRFQAVEPRWSLFKSPAQRYAKGFFNTLADTPRLVEVHNDIGVFQCVTKAFPASSSIFYLHQDPALIPQLETPKQRWQFINQASAIVCASDYVRRRFLTGLEAARTDHVRVVYHGIDIQPRLPKERLILFVGRIIPEKGLLELIKAMQLLLPHHPSWRLLVVGGSPTKPTALQKAYLHQVQNGLKGLGRQAIWLNAQPHDKLQRLYARAAIAVAPSLAPEPVGRTALEALAAGTALVSSGLGSLYEILGPSGVIVDPLTPNGLALAIQGLIEDHQTLDGVQQDCHHRAEHFALEGSQHQIDQLRSYLLSNSYVV